MHEERKYFRETNVFVWNSMFLTVSTFVVRFIYWCWFFLTVIFLLALLWKMSLFDIVFDIILIFGFLSCYRICCCDFRINTGFTVVFCLFRSSYTSVWLSHTTLAQPRAYVCRFIFIIKIKKKENEGRNWTRIIAKVESRRNEKIRHRNDAMESNAANER